MKTDINKNSEQSEVELKVEVSAEEIQPYLKQAAKELSEEKEIKGFRPGKAPVDVVESVFGPAKLLNEMANKAIPHFFVEAVLDNEIDALAQPSVAIDEIGKDKGIKFTAKVSVLPEVKLGNLKDIEVEKREVKTEDKEVQEELEKLAKTRSDYIDVAKPVEEGDTVKVDFRISKDGTLLEGGESKDHPINVGEGYFMKEFEDNLVGMQAGESKEFKINFPEDYKQKDLAGTQADAWVNVKAVQKRVLPKIDDEFAKKLGKFESLDDLKKQLKENMAHEKEHKEKERYQQEMVNKMAEGSEFTAIPSELVNKEIDRMIGEFEQMLTMQQRSIDDYLKQNNRTMDQVREEMKPNAEKSVKVGLALREFAKQEDIKVEESEIEEKVQKYTEMYGKPEEAEKNVNVDEMKEQIAYMLRNQKAMEALEEKINEE